LKALTEMFVRADAEVVDRAPEAARALEGLSGCANLVALNTRVRPPDDAAIAAQLTLAQVKLAEGKALHEAGKFQAALGVLGPAAEELQRLGYRPEWGRALYLRARAEQMLGRFAAAEESLYQATWAAEEGRDDELKALAWIQLIETVGVSQARLKEARRLALHAAAAVARLGKGVDPDIEADLHMRLGQLCLAEADADQAFAELEQARRLLEGKHGPAHPGLVRVLLSQASALGRKGHYEASLDLYHRAMAITERSLGPEHPELASVHNNLASALYSLARWEEAGQHYQRALEIYQTNFGPEDRRVGQTRHNLSGLLRAEGKVHEALAQSEAALVILEKSVGPSHPHVARASLNAATCLMDLHREDEALQHARRALDIWRGLGPDHPDTALALRVIGQVLVRQRRFSAAREAFEQAAAVMERNHREDSPVLASILVELARIDLSTGQPRQAFQRAERARGIAEATLGPDHPHTGDACLAEGRARLALGDPEKALPLLRQARAIMERGKENGPERRELDQALARAEAASARRSHRP
jgi:serine/threonine-protein kinase